VGYVNSNIHFIPCSGLEGENIISTSRRRELSWYTGTSLLHCLESLQIPSRSLDDPLRLSIADVSRGSRANVVNVTGRIDSGVLQIGDQVVLEPGGNRGSVRYLLSDGDHSFSVAGDVVTVGIHGIDQNVLKPGDVVCQADHPIPVSAIFTARVITFDTVRPIIQGSSVIVHRGRIDEPATVKQIVSLIDKSDGRILKRKPRHIPVGGAAVIQIALTNKRGMPLEPFHANRDIGRVVLRAEGATVAAGIIVSLD